MRITRNALLKVVSLVTLTVGVLGAQSHVTVTNLFRSYLVLRIPNLIAKNPHENPDQWDNAARIAGELKITEACHVLEQWVGEPHMGPNEGDLYDHPRLLDDPAALALSQIGEPAIPTLREILDNRSTSAREGAARALAMIGSPAAMATLRQHEPHERDANIKEFIGDALAPKASRQRSLS